MDARAWRAHSLAAAGPVGHTVWRRKDEHRRREADR